MGETKIMPAPKDIFADLCRQQGRMKSWAGRKAGLTPQQLANKFAGRYGYSWQPGEREAIADALGVTVAMIWGDEPERVVRAYHRRTVAYAEEKDVG